MRKERFEPGAFDYTLQDESREVVLQIGDDAGQVLGSRLAGSLILNDSAEGPELPRTDAATDQLRGRLPGAAGSGHHRTGRARVLPGATGGRGTGRRAAGTRPGGGRGTDSGDCGGDPYRLVDLPGAQGQPRQR